MQSSLYYENGDKEPYLLKGFGIVGNYFIFAFKNRLMTLSMSKICKITTNAAMAYSA